LIFAAAAIDAAAALSLLCAAFDFRFSPQPFQRRRLILRQTRRHFITPLFH